MNSGKHKRLFCNTKVNTRKTLTLNTYKTFPSDKGRQIFTVKSQRVKIFGFKGPMVWQLISEWEWVGSKQFYLWTLNFEFHIIFRCPKTFFFGLQFFKNVKPNLSSWVISTKRRAVTRFGPQAIDSVQDLPPHTQKKTQEVLVETQIP